VAEKLNVEDAQKKDTKAMKQKREIFTITGSILLFTLACATLMPTPEPTALPTATQEPTSTLVPTPTGIPPTATAGEKSEIDLEKQADGTTLFTDSVGGYQLVFPENWVTLDLTEDKIEDAFDPLRETNPDISPGMLSMAKQLLTDNTRFMALDTSTGHYSGDHMTVAYSIFDENTGNIPLGFLVDATAQALPQQLPNAEILSSGVTTNSNDVEFGVIELKLIMNDAAGNALTVYEKVLIFQNNDLTIMTVLATHEDLREAVMEHFNQIQDSISLLP
jgi:hypothetical protein